MSSRLIWKSSTFPGSTPGIRVKTNLFENSDQVRFSETITGSQVYDFSFLNKIFFYQKIKIIGFKPEKKCF